MRSDFLNIFLGAGAEVGGLKPSEKNHGKNVSTL
jgi:hypothetical protein